MILSSDFAWARETIQKYLTLDSGKFVDYRLAPWYLKLSLLFGVGFMHF